MCPAYKVSGDETRSTRTRANVLREILTRGFESEAFASVSGGRSVFDIPELSEVLDSCLACKGCLSECPSNVDMTKLRSEVLQQKYDRHGTPFRSWQAWRRWGLSFARSIISLPLGSRLPGLSRRSSVSPSTATSPH